MSSYTVILGDTFESIARKVYGTEQEADFIARANPGVAEPLTAGIIIVTPSRPGAPQDVQSSAVADRDDETAILIDGIRFRFWDTVRITRAIDSMATVEFSAPFGAEVPGFKELFQPFSYKTVVITVGGEPLFTGTMVAVNPVVENAQKIIAISGYSLPGVLNDCTPPASSYPLEFNDQGLQVIATTIAASFGISVEFLNGQGAVFERVACEPGKRALAFLTELAKQRNLIIASTPRGALVFQRSTDAGNPVARLQQGAPPVLSVIPFFSPQEYYSHITGLEPVIVGLKGSQFTVKNPRLLGVIRPLTFNASDTLDADVSAAVSAKAARMFGSMASYSVRVATWRDPSGVLWSPNTTIKLLAPDAMIYNEYEFVVRSVEFERSSATETATLNLVMPGSFNGEIPETLPWDV